MHTAKICVFSLGYFFLFLEEKNPWVTQTDEGLAFCSDRYSSLDMAEG